MCAILNKLGAQSFTAESTEVIATDAIHSLSCTVGCIDRAVTRFLVSRFGESTEANTANCLRAEDVPPSARKPASRNCVRAVGRHRPPRRNASSYRTLRRSGRPHLMHKQRSCETCRSRGGGIGVASASAPEFSVAGLFQILFLPTSACRTSAVSCVQEPRP